MSPHLQCPIGERHKFFTLEYHQNMRQHRPVSEGPAEIKCYLEHINLVDEKTLMGKFTVISRAYYENGKLMFPVISNDDMKYVEFTESQDVEEEESVNSSYFFNDTSPCITSYNYEDVGSIMFQYTTNLEPHRPSSEGPAKIECYLEEIVEDDEKTLTIKFKVSCITYCENGKRHRPANEGPAKIRYDYQGYVIKKYYHNGKLHRDNDLPAIESTKEDKEWYVNGQRHRDNDLPAIEGEDGTKEWWANGKRHRDNDLPAIESTKGDKEWYVNGQRHRCGGLPAVEFNNNFYTWFINGNIRRTINLDRF